MTDRIFKPLGMKTATTSITEFSKDTDLATPHAKVKGKPTPVASRNADNMAPAGSINASAADMAEYLKFQLAKGKVGDKRLIERDTFQVMQTPLMILPKASIELNPEARLRSYALGWFVSDFRGTTLVEHGGNIDGMTASVMMLPEKKMGVVILANCTGSLLPASLGFDILDRLLGHEPQNLAMTMSLLGALGEYSVQVAAEPDESKRIKGTKPTFAIEKYVGKYQDDLHPSLLVKLNDEKLAVVFNTFQYDLEHWHYDTFVGTDSTHVMPKVLFTFDQSAEAGVATIRFKPLIAEELRFKKVSNRPKR